MSFGAHTDFNAFGSNKLLPKRIAYADTSTGAYAWRTGESVLKVDSSGSGTIAVTLPPAAEWGGQFKTVYGFGAAGQITVAGLTTTTLTAASGVWALYYSDGVQALAVASKTS